LRDHRHALAGLFPYPYKLMPARTGLIFFGDIVENLDARNVGGDRFPSRPPSRVLGHDGFLGYRSVCLSTGLRFRLAEEFALIRIYLFCGSSKAPKHQQAILFLEGLVAGLEIAVAFLPRFDFGGLALECRDVVACLFRQRLEHPLP